MLRASIGLIALVWVLCILVLVTYDPESDPSSAGALMSLLVLF